MEDSSMDFMKTKSRRPYTSVTVDKTRRRAQSNAQAYGYELHPDSSILDSLLEGLRRNEERYSYPACPCRLALGDFERDRDIICPCDYRDADVQEFGFCYCGLYVRPDIVANNLSITPIPERRPLEKQRGQLPSMGDKAHKVPTKASVEGDAGTHRTRVLWFCRQCGYVCFREAPPLVCPICGAKKELFAKV
jgi:ferredoxin-thioredoxin reductase catalytic subunit